MSRDVYKRQVSGNANVRGNAVVDDHALVMNGTVRGYAHVAGNAREGALFL